MKQVSKLKPQKTIFEIASKCMNKELVDQLIQRYLEDTRSAVENIIRMCESVSKMHRAFMNKEISSHDIDYFCMSVGLQKNKSQYRKYICIGNHADQFRSHIKKMPKAISVLYEITTLNSESFDLLINSGKIQPELTLKQVKTLAKKPNKLSVKSKNTNQLQTISISFDYENLSNGTRLFLSNLVQRIRQDSELQIASPFIQQLEISSDEETYDSTLELQA
jgi:hypothetical protein